MEVEVEIKKIFDATFQAEVIGQVFSSYIKPAKNDHANRLKSCIVKFQPIIAGKSIEDQTSLITTFIKFIHSQQASRRVNFTFDFLEICVKDGHFPLKPVLDSLQCSDLVYTKKLHWCKTYEFIRKYVHLIDYKACRNLLHSMIVKMRDIPSSAWNTEKQQVDSICRTIEYLLDPEACLLPGYLAVNEIRMNAYDEQLAIPWPLHDKLTAFVDRFRATAAMVTTTGKWALLPVVDHAFYQLTSTWKLEPETLRFPHRRELPYCKEMYQRQWKLLRYILRETYSRDMVLQVLGLQKHQKQRCVALETELVELMVSSMQECDDLLMADSDYIAIPNKYSCRLLWQHLSSQVIYVVLYQLASFPLMIEGLYTSLLSSQKKGVDIRRGREHLTWCLLQFISGSIQKNPISDFLPVIKLIRLLYYEREPLPLPDVTKSSCALCFSATCILMHLNRKAQSKSDTSSDDSEYSKLHQIPVALQRQHEFLGHSLQSVGVALQDYQIALVCNACSTTTDLFNVPITKLVDSVYGDNPGTVMPGTGCVAFNKTVPLKMELLDSLTAHTKMSMLHHIGSKIQKLGQSKSTTALSPALAETYSRLLVYTEIETLGIKGLVNQVLPKICEYKAWGILHTLLEMISYRIHHIQPLCRIQLLTTLHSLANSQHADHKQLYLGIESTALKLIMGFDNFDIKPQLVRSFSDQKQFVSQSSEELNRVLVLTLARSIHVTGTETISGSWCVDILKAVMTATPHKWSQQTLACFPHSVQEYFQQQTVECLNKEELKADVDEEYAKWGALLTGQETGLTEADALKYFRQTSTPPYFICLVWKILLDGKVPSSTSYKVLENISASQLSAQIRTFADLLVYEFTFTDGSRAKICTDVILDMIWKYNLVFLDRLILCLALRSSDANDVQVAMFIIQYILIKPDDFRARVRSCEQDVDSSDHWLQHNWHSRHMAFHQKFPENYYFEGLLKHCSGADKLTSSGDSSGKHNYLPTYFGNITLRFLSVLDILIHRFLEVHSSSSKSLETLLDHLGSLYKFHDQPITYLFNTLHYYESKLRGRYSLKKKLVTTVIGAVTENKPSDWSLSPDFMNHVISEGDANWVPNSAYFAALIQRFVDTIRGKKPPPFTSRDWRFNEFPNSSAHALHVTCVEVLALPMPGDQAGLALMNVVLKTQPLLDRDDIFSWMNALALILTALPEIYWKPLHQNILEMMSCETLKSPIEKGSSYPYHILAYNKQRMSYSDLPCTRLLALAHIVWYHMSIGQLSLVSQFLKEEVKPLVETELQLLYVFHLIGPYFPRFRQERTRCMMDVALLLYDTLLQVSKQSTEIQFVDEIADFLYHVKYMHIGTAINDKVEEISVNLQPALRKRLQFITQASSASANTAGRQQVVVD